MDYIIIETRQFGVESEGPEAAIKEHLDGKSIALSITYQAHPRPPRIAPANTVGPTSSVQPTAAQKLATK